MCEWSKKLRSLATVPSNYENRRNTWMAPVHTNGHLVILMW